MTYILNRLLSIALTLFLISVITFAVTTILPGDVATMIMGTQSNPEALAGLRKSLGLNDPLIIQYGRWIGGMATGDWGRSLVFKVPIADLLIQKIKASSLIVVMSMAIASMCAVPLGVWAAVHRNRWQDGVEQQRGAGRRQPAGLLLGDHDDPSVCARPGLVSLERLRRSRRQPVASRSPTRSCPRSPSASA